MPTNFHLTTIFSLKHNKKIFNEKKNDKHHIEYNIHEVLYFLHVYIRLVQTKQKQVTSNNIVIRIYLIVTISYETHTHAHTRTKREKDRKKYFF